MNLNVNISFECDSEEQFLQLIEKLSGMDIQPTVKLSKPPPQEGKGPNERAYLEKSGLSRFRMTKDEAAKVEAGTATRESIALDRMAELSDDYVVAVAQGAQLPADDRKSVFGEDLG